MCCLVTGGSSACGKRSIKYREVESLCSIAETNVTCFHYTQNNLKIKKKLIWAQIAQNLKIAVT